MCITRFEIKAKISCSLRIFLLIYVNIETWKKLVSFYFSSGPETLSSSAASSPFPFMVIIGKPNKTSTYSLFCIVVRLLLIFFPISFTFCLFYFSVLQIFKCLFYFSNKTKPVSGILVFPHPNLIFLL